MIDQGYALSAIAARAGMPPLATLRQWRANDEAFGARYKDARNRRREMFADDVVALADTLASESAAGMKLRLDARKWRVALMDKEDAASDHEDDRGGNETDDLIERLEAARKRVDAPRRAEREAQSDDGTAATHAPGNQGHAREERSVPVPISAAGNKNPAETPDDHTTRTDAPWSIWYGPTGEGVADATARGRIGADRWP